MSQNGNGILYCSCKQILLRAVIYNLHLVSNVSIISSGAFITEMALATENYFLYIANNHKPVTPVKINRLVQMTLECSIQHYF